MIGPVGRTVIANIERLRKARRMSHRGLSTELAAVGRPIGDTVLHRQSTGKRRVDADDLAAFAAVLGVAPADLLRAPGAAPAVPAPNHPAVRASRELTARIEELIEASGDPQALAYADRRVDRAVQRVQLEVEELVSIATRRHRRAALAEDDHATTGRTTP
jgi:hypothetical protein